jgi:hypothetical protein
VQALQIRAWSLIGLLVQLALVALLCLESHPVCQRLRMCSCSREGLWHDSSSWGLLGGGLFSSVGWLLLCICVRCNIRLWHCYLLWCHCWLLLFLSHCCLL